MYQEQKRGTIMSGVIALLIILIIALGVYAIYRTYSNSSNEEIIDQTEQTTENELIVPSTLDKPSDENPLV